MLNDDFQNKYRLAVEKLNSARRSGYSFGLISEGILEFTFDTFQTTLLEPGMLRTILGDRFTNFQNELSTHIERIESFLNGPGNYENPRQLLAKIEGDYSHFLNDPDSTEIFALIKAVSLERNNRNEAQGLFNEIESAKQSANQLRELYEQLRHQFASKSEQTELKLHDHFGKLTKLIELEEEKAKKSSHRATEKTSHYFKEEAIENSVQADKFVKKRDVAHRWLFVVIALPILVPIARIMWELTSHYGKQCGFLYEFIRAISEAIPSDPKYVLGVYSLLVATSYLNVHFATKNYYHFLAEKDFYINRAAISDSYKFFVDSVTLSDNDRTSVINELVKRVFEPNSTKQFDTSDLTTPIAELIKAIKKE